MASLGYKEKKQKKKGCHIMLLTFFYLENPQSCTEGEWREKPSRSGRTERKQTAAKGRFECAFIVASLKWMTYQGLSTPGSAA